MAPTIPILDKNRLYTLVHDPATTHQRWGERAACLKPPLYPDAYFPENGETPSDTALGRCAKCPVAHECLATALIHEARVPGRFGWWGGLSPDQRECMWASLGAPAVPRQPPPEPSNLIAVARYLRDQNRTITTIAAELGCSERTVYRYLAAPAA